MDGIIEIDTKIDNTGIDKGVNSVNKSLGKVDNSLSNTSKKINDTFTGSSSKIDTLTSRIERQQQAIDKENIKLQQLRAQYDALTSGETTPKSLIALEKELSKVEQNYNKLTAKSKDLYSQLQMEKSFSFGVQDNGKVKALESELKSLDNEIMITGERAEFLNAKIDQIKLDPNTSEEAKQLAGKIGLTDENVKRLNNDLSKTRGQLDTAMGKSATKKIDKVEKSTRKATTGLEHFYKRLRNIAIGALLFNAISSSLTKLRQYLGGLLATNIEFTKAMNRVKTSLATAFQPIYEAILPALTSFMNALAKGITYIAYFINALFGKTLSQSKKNAEALNKQAEALKNVGSSAKDSGKSLASFDKANVLSSNKGGEASLGDIIGSTDLPNIDTTIFDKLENKLKDIIGWLQKTFGPSWDKFWKGLEPNLKTFSSNMGRLFEGLKPIWGNFLKYLENQWLPAFVETIDIAGEIFNGLFDTFNLVLGDIIDVVILPFLDTLVNNMLPVLTDFSLKVWETFQVTFEQVKMLFDTVWTQGILPAVQLLSQIWQDVWVSIDETWQKWGQPIFDNIKIAIEKTGQILKDLWDNFLKPIVDNIIKIVKELWDNHLGPLFKNILDAIGELINGALEIYNKFIAPIVDWLIKTLGPVFAFVFNGILTVVGGVLGHIIDAINGVITTLKGIIQFITGVFTGNWKKAWEGVQNIFGGVWEDIKSLFKASIKFIIDGINVFIKGLNKLKIPDWVPVVGGKGLSIPTIPRLATGAVIPPNKEFLAVLGDQKQGNNIETPESLLRKVVREETGNTGTDQPMIIKVYVGDEEVFSKYEKWRDDKDFATNGGN